MFKSWIKLGLLLGTIGLLLTGCNRDPYALSASDQAAFKDATPELRQLWEAARKADQADDFGTASANYRNLLRQNLTTDQLIAVQNAVGGFNYRLNDAADKGNKAAQQALEAGKDATPHR